MTLNGVIMAKTGCLYSTWRAKKLPPDFCPRMWAFGPAKLHDAPRHSQDTPMLRRSKNHLDWLT
jgi:hypothetical protein